MRRYVRQSCNCKKIECTFASAESRREFIKMRSKQEFQPYDPHCANEQLVGAYSYVDNNQHSQHCYHTCDNLFMKLIELNSLRS